MAAFDYFLSVTGDCSNTNVGAISLSLTGGTAPYTIEWVDPPLGVAVTTDIFPIYKTSLSATTYGVRVNDSTLEQNLEFYINIPVSSGCCATIESTVNTNNGENNGSVTVATTSAFSSVEYNLYSTNGDLIYNQTNNLCWMGEFDNLNYVLNNLPYFKNCVILQESPIPIKNITQNNLIPYIRLIV